MSPVLYNKLVQNLIEIKGIVKSGQSRGRKLGFPTANIDLTQNIDEGIYISQIIINGKKYNSLTFIGKVKTFNESKYHAETYILDFDENIYGEEVDITLIKKLRDNQKFSSEEELIKQMEKDKKDAEEFFSS